MSMGTWADFVAYLEEVYQPSLTPYQRGLSCPDPAVPADIWQAAKLVFPSPDGWLDNPIPQLKGQSALEAIKGGKPDDVRKIIMGVAEFFLPPPDEVIPYEEWEQGVESLSPEGAEPSEAG